MQQEYGYNIVATVLYFTAFIVQLSVWAPANSYFTNSNVAAGVSIIKALRGKFIFNFHFFAQVFALFNFVVYALATFVLHKEVKEQPK